jgi:hypothetical protein
MFELLKELFRKYPTSFQSEKALKFEEIKNFDNIAEIKDYIIDSVAIEKSYDIESWETLLSKRFKIKVFKSKKSLEQIKALNSLRNIILHSGNKTNSRFSNEMSRFLKTPVPIGEPFGLSMKKYFEVLHATFSLLIKNVENN